MRTIVSFLLIFIVVFASCRSSKKIQSAIAKKDTLTAVGMNPATLDSMRLIDEILKRMKSNQIDFTSFSSKIKVQYKDNKQRNYDFNAFVRIQKDSIIWLSINASFGIEAFRVMITPDSVKVMDKLAKQVQYRSVEYLRELIQLPLDFNTLQSLIVGNPVYLDSTQILRYKETEQVVSLSTAGNFFKQLLSIRKGDYALLHSKLDDVDPRRSRTADFTFNDYLMINGRLFPAARRIIVSEKTRLDISLDYKQVEFDIPLSFPFTIPRNYSIQ